MYKRRHQPKSASVFWMLSSFSQTINISNFTCLIWLFRVYIMLLFYVSRLMFFFPHSFLFLFLLAGYTILLFTCFHCLCLFSPSSSFSSVLIEIQRCGSLSEDTIDLSLPASLRNTGRAELGCFLTSERSSRKVGCETPPPPPLFFHSCRRRKDTGLPRDCIFRPSFWSTEIQESSHSLKPTHNGHFYLLSSI